MIPVGALIAVIVVLVILGIVAASRSIKVVQQYEKGIIYRFGRVMPEIRGPGLAVIRPVGDRMQILILELGSDHAQWGSPIHHQFLDGLRKMTNGAKRDP